jgi:hypothetical protein
MAKVLDIDLGATNFCVAGIEVLGIVNRAWLTVSPELHRAASDKTRGGQGPAGPQSATQPEPEGAPDGSKHEEGPIIDAEVVDERKAA